MNVGASVGLLIGRSVGLFVGIKVGSNVGLGFVGIGVGTATYFLSKKNKTFTIIGLVVGGIAGI